MNRVCKDGKYYGYDVATGKLFDPTTYKFVEEKKAQEPRHETWEEFKENVAKSKPKVK